MNKTLSGLLILAFALTATLTLTAQEQKKKSAAETEFDDVMKELDASFEKWQKEQQEKMRKAKEAAEKAKAEGKEAPAMPAMRMRPPASIFAPTLTKLQAGATKYKGSDEAIRYHTMVLNLGGIAKNNEAILAAATALTTEHINSKKLDGVVSPIYHSSRFIGQEKANSFLATIAKMSPHSAVKFEAILAPLKRDLTDSKVGSSEYEGAKASALKAAKESGDQGSMAKVQSIIDGREKLVEGGTALDISGVDLDGTAFKLSDYKGKVVLLDFWGDW